jgi:DNA-binding transcriptional regulator YiaG
MKKKYQSEILMVCHQDAEEMYKLGLIDDAKMREFDEGCLLPETTLSVTTSQNTILRSAAPAFASQH